MAPELGIFSLILAFVLSLSQAFFGLAGAWRGKPVWMAVARPAVTGQFVFVVMAFACLVYSFVHNDFSVLYVARNSNSHLPLFYQVAALWGAHEGSLLLWILILSIWSVAVAAFSRQLPLSFSSRVLGVMGLVSGGFMLFTLWTSNPFMRLIPAAADGADLNPVLQDFALAIHPPMLYTGYVGFSGGLRIRDRRDAGRTTRSNLGQVDPAVDYLRVAVSDHRHRARQLVGLLRAGLGRMVVLGPGRERILHALAGGHGADPLAQRHREARHLQELDTAAGDICLFAEPRRNLLGALRRPGVGALVRHRPDPWALYSRVSGTDHRRFIDSVRVAGAEAVRARRLRAVFAGVLSVGEQRDPGERRRARALGHPVSLGLRTAGDRQDLGRAACIRGDVPGARAAVDGVPRR